MGLSRERGEKHGGIEAETRSLGDPRANELRVCSLAVFPMFPVFHSCTPIGSAGTRFFARGVPGVPKIALWTGWNTGEHRL